MKLVCLQENLIQGLNIARVAISKNTTLPIINNFLLEVKNNQLTVIATNLEIGIEIMVRGKIDQEGVITAPAIILTDFVNGLPNKKVVLESNNNIINITCEKFNARINGIAAEDFPSIPKTQEKESINFNANELKTGFDQVVGAASTSDIRLELAGVFVKVAGNKMILAATDSFRLAEKIIKLDKDFGMNYSMILPSKTVIELGRILDQDEKVQIFKDQNQVLFKIGLTKLTARLIQAEYPDYPQIIPQESLTKIVLNKQELVKNIKVAGVFSNSRVNDVKVSFKDKTMIVKSNTPEIGENLSEVKIDKLEGEIPKEEIVYNYHSLLDGLNNIDSSDVLIELNGDVGPTILRPVEADDYLYITKPLKIT